MNHGYLLTGTIRNTDQGLKGTFLVLNGFGMLQRGRVHPAPCLLCWEDGCTKCCVLWIMDALCTVYCSEDGLYVRLAQDLDMFGVRFFPVRNSRSAPMMLGVDPCGLRVYSPENV